MNCCISIYFSHYCLCCFIHICVIYYLNNQLNYIIAVRCFGLGNRSDTDFPVPEGRDDSGQGCWCKERGVATEDCDAQNYLMGFCTLGCFVTYSGVCI